MIKKNQMEICLMFDIKWAVSINAHQKATWHCRYAS